MRPTVKLMLLCVWTIAFSFLGLPANADLVYSPTAVIGNTMGSFSAAGLVPENLINQTGLDSGFTSGVTDFDTYINTGPLHDTFVSGKYWASDFAALPGDMDFDLGESLAISRMVLWNRDGAGGSIVVQKTSKYLFQMIRYFRAEEHRLVVSLPQSVTENR